MKTPIVYRTHKEVFLEKLAESEENRQTYLQVVIETYEEDKFLPGLLLAIRNIAAATGGVNELANKTSLNRQTLYKALSPNGNPSFALVDKIINALGMKFTLQAKQ